MLDRGFRPVGFSGESIGYGKLMREVRAADAQMLESTNGRSGGHFASLMTLLCAWQIVFGRIVVTRLADPIRSRARYCKV